MQCKTKKFREMTQDEKEKHDNIIQSPTKKNKHHPLNTYLVKQHFQMDVADPKSAAIPLNTWLQTVRDQNFPMRGYTTMYLKELQSYRLLKFKVWEKAVSVLNGEKSSGQSVLNFKHTQKKMLLPISAQF